MALDFAQSIAANMAMAKDPDWIIKIGDYTVEKCVEWEFVDNEKDQSHLRVVMPNPDFKLSGKFKYDQEMTIRFGYSNEMSPTAYFLVDAITREYPNNKPMRIEVTGCDYTKKLTGGNNRGNQGKGDDAKQLRKVLEASKLEMKGDSKGEDSDSKGSLYNEHDRAAAYRWGNAMAAERGYDDGGESPKSPLKNESSGSGGGGEAGIERHGAYAFGSSGDWTGNGKGTKRHDNRLSNHGGRNSQEVVTGTLKLRGFPTLRSKGTVSLAGLGEEDNGTWYVATAKHYVKEGGGLLTEATLLRGGDGKGDVGGKDPMVMYADIWQKGAIYVGQRQTSGNAQATFTYGSDDHFLEFKAVEKPQTQRSGGEPKMGKGQAVWLRKYLEKQATEDKDSGSESSGDGK